MRTIRGNPYLSRPVGTNKPYRMTLRRPVVSKEVFIGTHNPGAHYAPVAQVFVEPEQLYDNRKRR